jgi:RNA polymerase sigma factor (sigma-70 family)
MEFLGHQAACAAASPPARAEPLTDAAVMRRSWDEPDRFAEIFERHAEEIHRYAARRMGAEVADDVLAETFVIAFQRRRRYDIARPDARPWLYGIATNLLHRHRRAEARRLRALSRELRSAAPEPLGDAVDARVSAYALRAHLAEALASLPARHRDVLLLVAWAELDYAEAAAALRVPIGTVRSRLHRARGALRQALGPYVDSEDT